MQNNQPITDIIEEIVMHNERQLQLVDGDQGKAENLYTFEFGGIAVYNPFYDETFRFEVQPLAYYGEDVIRTFVSDYRTSQQ